MKAISLKSSLGTWLICVMAMLMVPAIAKAQREYSPNFSIGVRGGATLSSMSFTPEVHQSMIQGITMGVTARYTEEKF